MDKIVKIIGGIMLTAGVSVVLLGIVFEDEMTAMLGAGAKIENHIDYAGYSDVVSGIISKAAPKIQLNETIQVEKGTATDVKSLFDVKLDGQAVFVNATLLDTIVFKVDGLSDEYGNDILSLYNTTDGTVTFTSAGIYTMQISITDEYNSTTEAQFKIPVGE